MERITGVRTEVVGLQRESVNKSEEKKGDRVRRSRDRTIQSLLSALGGLLGPLMRRKAPHPKDNLSPVLDAPQYATQRKGLSKGCVQKAWYSPNTKAR